MPPSRPTAAELLDAVRDFLERDILPALAADVRFQCRVAINVLATVRRELELGPEFESRERDRLAALLGETDARSSLDALNRRLARKIREGAGDLDPAAARRSPAAHDQGSAPDQQPPVARRVPVRAPFVRSPPPAPPGQARKVMPAGGIARRDRLR